ncbi:MAG: hypothetical protein PF693_14395 [Spirochaetia bacterium]|nr:hypothetical protein [Spirochaetia bacterium]
MTVKDLKKYLSITNDEDEVMIKRYKMDIFNDADFIACFHAISIEIEEGRLSIWGDDERQ